MMAGQRMDETDRCPACGVFGDPTEPCAMCDGPPWAEVEPHAAMSATERARYTISGVCTCGTCARGWK